MTRCDGRSVKEIKNCLHDIAKFIGDHKQQSPKVIVASIRDLNKRSMKWQIVYTRQKYMALLNKYSDHIHSNHYLERALKADIIQFAKFKNNFASQRATLMEIAQNNEQDQELDDLSINQMKEIETKIFKSGYHLCPYQCYIWKYEKSLVEGIKSSIELMNELNMVILNYNGLFGYDVEMNKVFIDITPNVFFRLFDRSLPEFIENFTKIKK